jgi:hypothetical protein
LIHHSHYVLTETFQRLIPSFKKHLSSIRKARRDAAPPVLQLSGSGVFFFSLQMQTTLQIIGMFACVGPAKAAEHLLLPGPFCYFLGQCQKVNKENKTSKAVGNLSAEKRRQQQHE